MLIFSLFYFIRVWFEWSWHTMLHGFRCTAQWLDKFLQDAVLTSVAAVCPVPSLLHIMSCMPYALLFIPMICSFCYLPPPFTHVSHTPTLFTSVLARWWRGRVVGSNRQRRSPSVARLLGHLSSGLCLALSEPGQTAALDRGARTSTGSLPACGCLRQVHRPVGPASGRSCPLFKAKLAQINVSKPSVTRCLVQFSP